MNNGVTPGAPCLQVSLLCCGGNALCLPQNVSAPPLLQSEKKAKRQNICFQTHASFTHVHWNVSPAVIILTVGMKLSSNLPVCAIECAIHLAGDVENK